MTAHVSSSKASCTEISDWRNIKRVIEEEIGFLALDKKLFELYRGWVVDFLLQAIRGSGSDVAQQRYYKEQLVLQYASMGKYDLAESLYKEFLERFRDAWVLEGLADVYMNQGLYHLAVPLLEELLNKTHRDKLSIMMHHMKL